MMPSAEHTSLPSRLHWHLRHVLRAGGLSAGWPQLGIGVIAVIVFSAGVAAIDWLFSGETTTRIAPGLVETYAVGFSDDGPTQVGIRSQWQQDQLWRSAQILSFPWASIGEPVANLGWNRHGQTEPTVAPPSLIAVVLQMAWAVLCWSLLGTASCRSVAISVAKDRTETLREAIQFALPRWPLTMSAPAIPGGAILAIAVGLIVVAWFGRLPWIGTPLLSVASPLLFLAGLAIAFLAFVIILGWPLMVAGMGVEDCDGFGALSRAYSFLTGQPLLAVFNVGISAMVGSVLVALVGGLFSVGLLAEANFLNVSIGAAERWITVMQWSHFFAQGLLLSYAASLFWTLATLNYLLLRYEVDGKPLDDVASSVAEVSAQRELPVVGIPATDYKPAETDGQPVAQDAQG